MKKLITHPACSTVFGIFVGFGLGNLLIGKEFFANPEQLFYALFGVMLFLFNLWTFNHKKTITVTE